MLDVATILTSLRLRTSEMSARSVGGGTAIVCLRFGVHNLTELENVRTRLRGISGRAQRRERDGVNCLAAAIKNERPYNLPRKKVTSIPDFHRSFY